MATSPVELGHLTFSEDGSTVQVNEITPDRKMRLCRQFSDGLEVSTGSDRPGPVGNIRLSRDGR